jgi:CelD/BcsL family acetyltransferase involved in cellulose biosynthesis
MHVNVHSDFTSLTPLATNWNELAGGVPFRRWEWVEAWWRHYSYQENGRPKRDRELFILTVWDDNEQLVGIAPWYRVQTGSSARVIRFLGDGEVCSDYVTILCRDGQESTLSEALADWLSIRNQNSTATQSASGYSLTSNRRHRVAAGDFRWDRLEFIGVAAADVVVHELLERLQTAGNIVHYGRTPNAWRVLLPTSWEEFLMILSKPHRNRLRRADKIYFQSGKVQAHQVRTAEEFDKFFAVLIKLHQGRWQRRGLPGCFASRPFHAFHREIAASLFADGRSTLSWLEMDEKPLAAEYRLHGDGVMYAYQCGIDPDRLQVKPGELANMAAIKNAIERGQHAYDFLRGDEPYKSRWRAVPQPMLSLRVIPPHRSARLRHSAWVAGQNVKQWIKNGLQTVGQWKARSPGPANAEPQGE